MIEYYKMAFEKYADFSSRSTRSEYWYFFLTNILIFLVLGLLGFMGMDMDSGSAGPLAWIGFGLAGLYALAVFIPSIAVAIRRLHDTGRSGWWYLIGVIPIINYIGGIVLLVFYCLESQRGPNQWGPEPGKSEGLKDTLVDMY